MKYIAVQNFATIDNGRRINAVKGDIVELKDVDIITECISKKLVEDAPNVDELDEVDDDLFNNNVEGQEDELDYLSVEQIKKLKTKAEVVAYGQSIGLDEMNENFTRDELDEMVIEYIENLEVENEDV